MICGLLEDDSPMVNGDYSSSADFEISKRCWMSLEGEISLFGPSDSPLLTSG